ncbi:MAG: lysophospholipid acyltransferase family protein [Sulfurospirillaceae bacterium]|nr:lysophospholipid acyltransferase family protein [Sulfurospirillaceae bacterium]
MKDFWEYFAIRCVLLFTRFIPKSLVYNFCKLVAKIFFKYNKRRSSLTLKNIRLAYPEKNDDEVLFLAKKSYESIAITLAEILLMLTDRIDFDAMVENTQEALEQIAQHINKPQGTIILTAHFSNWELAAHFLAKNGYPMVGIGRRGNNKFIEERLTAPFRAKYGNQMIYKDSAGTKMIKCLKSGGQLGILADQKASGVSSIKVKFFNQEADTFNSVAVLKLKYNPTILPIFVARQPSGKYKIIIKEPISYTAEELNDEKERIEKMTQKYNDVIEEAIRAYPEQWFWMHNRWRIQ